ncbi:MAG: DNA topoisomerase 3 [Muribaculaceae bacterium]
MRLCITEKPSVAKDIAAILHATTRRDGYYEGGDWRVTWTYGHLCCLKDPGDYSPTWQHWTLSALPMIPQRFGIKVINEKIIKQQFAVIKKLIAQADEVINCGDAGQEGELIQRWVMQKAGIKCPVKRLWISSLTDESIREGFKTLQPQEHYERLYHAGLSRAIGDWVLGINATRLYSLKYSQRGNVLSVGRVQTPTLALIVQRHHEIANFVPQDYWELRTIYREVSFAATKGKFDDPAKAQAVVDSIAAAPFVVTDITEKKGREAPPRLFDLTSLQVECNRKWGWSADTTLQLIQSLYEKKVTTYPRVDTTYLSEDLYPKIGDILRKMTPYADRTAPILAAKIPHSKKVFDNAKVTDHHAIIPTGQSPAALVGDERKLYHLIAMRFIAAFYPDCLFMQTIVEGKAAEVDFRATGKVITAPGWRALYAGSDDAKDATESESGAADTAGILPQFTKGESGPHTPSLAKKTTQPPKYYTEGTLLRAMESAGKTVDDEELREAMKENGIGRPSTRSAIIETLFKRKYIYRERKNIMASQAGIDLIALISEDLLKSAKLTGIWENRLRRIERGDYSPAEFIDGIKAMISSIVLNVMRDNSDRRIIVDQSSDDDAKSPAAKAKKGSRAAAKSTAGTRAPRIRSIAEIPCPICGEGHLLKGRSAYGCSRYAAGCALRLNFDQYPPDLTPAKLRDKIKKEFKS